MTEQQREAFEALEQIEAVAGWTTTEEIERLTAIVRAALSHAEGEAPFAYCFTDVNGRPTEFTDGPEHSAPEDKRVITALYRHPAPQAAVPEGWTDRHTRITRFALWRLINEGYHRANAAAQKGQPGTADDAAALLDDVERAEEARSMLAAAPTAPAPTKGEEIHVNVDGDSVYTLPLEPTGMAAPRFVVHVPAPPRTRTSRSAAMTERKGYINEMGAFCRPRKPPKIMWCVDHGPDESHLFDTDWFYRLRDARQFVSALAPAPIGAPRAYKITRWEWRADPIVPHREIASTRLVGTNIQMPPETDHDF